MKIRLTLAGLVLTVVVAAVALWTWPRHPNVLLITIDTLRADRVRCYGERTSLTPNIDRLAQAGVCFSNAFCDITWTTPSMSSVMTGSYATRHGMRSTYQQLDASNVTLAEVLKQHGYHTAAVIGSFPLDASFGLNQGFDSYDDHFTAPIIVGGDAPAEHVASQFSTDVDAQRLYQYLKAQADAYRPDSQVSDTAIAWLTEKRQEPFFLWVHYFGPHELNDMRVPFEQQNEHTISAYDSAVHNTDTQVGRLLAALDDLGLTRRTLTILHADHGQSLGEHLYVGHGKNLYDPTLRVPLVVRLPGISRPKRMVFALARNIDIMPTVLDVTGVPISEPIDGESLRPLWGRYGKPAPPRELYSETYLPAMEAFADEVPDGHGGTIRVTFRRRGLRTDQWKLVINEPWPTLDYAERPPLPQDLVRRLYSEELYNLKQNPLELRKDLVHDYPDVARELRDKIGRHAAVAAHPAPRRELDEAAKERLRSLGYMH